MEERKINNYGKGINSREWIYVKDHCRGLLTILNKGKNGERRDAYIVSLRS